MAEGGEYEWEMPTEAEMKVLVARRERSDKISKIMGQYLLKGYKMLDSACAECDNILLQDKQGQEYCVACSEVDNKENKDNPAVSVTEARKKVQEGMIGTSTNTVGVKVESTTEEPAATVGQAAPSSSSSGFIKKKKRNASSYTHEANQPLQRNSVDTFSRSIEIVSKQLESATIQLQKSRDIDARLKLTTYIKSCADAIKALREIE